MDVLPGLDLSVSEMTEHLDQMWEADAPGSPSSFRASQMNLVLHFGRNVSPEEAKERFNALLKFAQRYPGRIIVLCPTRSVMDGSTRAKLFSQCYIGDSLREMCCCEALILSYQPEECKHLANRISVWLESDLPVYHWFCGVPVSRIKEYFDSQLVGVRRFIYDSSYESEDFSQYNWPNPSHVGDLAMVRILPVRRAIGQYLSAYETIRTLWDGLELVSVRYGENMSGEGRCLLEWVTNCLGDCKLYVNENERKVRYQLEHCSRFTDSGCTLCLELLYEDARFFKWRKYSKGMVAEIEDSMGQSYQKITTRIQELGPDRILAEALFF